MYIIKAAIEIFRGSDTAIGSKSNGNFLGVFELLAKYDTVLNELMQRIQTKVHYLSNDTQNELIRLLAREIEFKNLSKVKKKKYYSVILDCTPNVSHKEQMSIILRSVTCTHGVGIDISKNFFGYLTVNDTTGKGLFNAFLNQAKNWDLNILDCRGQSYDNGANIKGKVKGVQARLYTLFSSSSPRWEILKSCVAILGKPQSDTRWESRINCVKLLRFYLKEILEALEKLEEHALENRDGATATEVRSLTEYIRTWPFLLSIIIWYDVLFQINKSSKLLQSFATSLDILASKINATKAFLYEYRENGFSDARVKASEIAEVLGIEKVFSMVRSRKKKSICSYECADHTYQPEHQYKADFFLPLIDTSIVSLADIDSEDLESELKRFVIVIKEEKNALLKSAYDFLNYIYKEELQETYPNLVIALRIILTLPVTVASAERSFSKLKLIKTFHRSTMVNERLSCLAMLSIENEVARTLSYEGIINEFASM
ncbi:uncharacterized protein LOC136088143 [Hydra vulgaris]|uniref:Uncharacterized protein LOC136088143 n=1 Tax=Hydra vulgaris TaxID=6087 RepID=A0ABM4D0W2_HYDVU